MAMLLGLVACVVSVPRCLFFVGAASVELHLGGPGHAAAAPRRFLGFAYRLFFATSLRLYLVVVSFGGGRCSDRCILASISGFRFVICFFLPFAFSVFSSSSLPLSSVALASYFLFLSVSVGRTFFLLVWCCSIRLRSSSACPGICALSLSLSFFVSALSLHSLPVSLSFSLSLSLSLRLSLLLLIVCVSGRGLWLFPSQRPPSPSTHFPPPRHPPSPSHPTNGLACPATTSPTSTHHHTPPPQPEHPPYHLRHARGSGFQRFPRYC